MFDLRVVQWPVKIFRELMHDVQQEQQINDISTCTCPKCSQEIKDGAVMLLSNETQADWGV